MGGRYRKNHVYLDQSRLPAYEELALQFRLARSPCRGMRHLVPSDWPLVIGGVGLEKAPAVVAVAIVSALGDDEQKALRASVCR